jgi:hypothetical protein
MTHIHMYLTLWPLCATRMRGGGGGSQYKLGWADVYEWEIEVRVELQLKLEVEVRVWERERLKLWESMACESGGRVWEFEVVWVEREREASTVVYSLS